MNTTLRLLVVLITATTLIACGGSGASSGNVAPAGSSSPPPTPPTGFLALTASDATVWSTQQSSKVKLQIKKADGTSLAGASVGIYRYTNVDPSAEGAPPGTNTTLSTPVPTARIDYGVSDAAGMVSFESALPAELRDVLVRVTENSQLIDYVQIVSISSLNGGIITIPAVTN
jgi:hypothetical protein